MDLALEILGWAGGLMAAGVLLVAGCAMILVPRRWAECWVRIDRLLRKVFYGGGWNVWEKLMPRRGYFLIPRDVDLDTPADLHAYWTSDRHWEGVWPWRISRAMGVALVAMSLPCLVGMLLQLAR